MEFPGVLVLGILLLTQFCGVSRDEASFCPEFLGVKVKNLKTQLGSFKKVCPQPPCLAFSCKSPLGTCYPTDGLL